MLVQLYGAGGDHDIGYALPGTDSDVGPTKEAGPVVELGCAGEEEGGAAVEVEEGSTRPMRADFGRVDSRRPRGWIGSYSDVASRPADARMAAGPPG